MFQKIIKKELDKHGALIIPDGYLLKEDGYAGENSVIVYRESAKEEDENFLQFAERQRRHAKEENNNALRTKYLDAYRKYQAAVNYGEFERADQVDEFIKALRNKEWSVLNNIPPALKYFAGECKLSESELKENRP